MRTAAEFRAKAARIRKLAAHLNDPGAAEALRQLAQEYEAEAERIEKTDANGSGSGPSN
jgi:hypothetical protein